MVSYVSESMMAEQIDTNVKSLSQISQLTAALSAALVANGDSSGADDCLSSLINCLSVHDLQQHLIDDRRSHFINICGPALELIAGAGLLYQGDLIAALTKHGLDVVESARSETKKFQDAIVAIQKYWSVKLRDHTLPTSIAVKVGNLFQHGIQFNPVESEVDTTCDLFFRAFKLDPKDVDAVEGLSRTILSRAEIFGSFDQEVFQELSRYIRGVLGLDNTSQSTPLSTTLDIKSRLSSCRRALLDLLCAQRRAFEVRLDLADICNVITGLRELLLIAPKEEEWLYKMHLSTSLRLRFRHGESLEDGDEALSLAIEALEAAPRTAQARAACFEAHAKILNVRYEFFETESLLDEIVGLFSKALSARLENPEPPYSLPIALLDLAKAMCFRYAKLGNSKDMEISVCIAKHVLRCFPPNDKQFDLRRSLCMQALGDIHLRLHWRSSGVEQLDIAMRYYQDCEEQNEYPGVFSLYGSTQYNYALVQKGYRRHDRSYINQAFERKRDWLAAHGGDNFHLSPIDNINYILIPGQAIPFFARGISAAEERDKLIEEAINTLGRAMEQNSIAARFVYVYEALAIALKEKAAFSRQLIDYEKSIEHFRSSSDVFTEDQSTNHLRIRLNFAGVLYMAAEIGNTVQYAIEGLQVVTPIIQDSRLSDWVRVGASVRAAGFHYNLLGNAKAASLALLKAHELIPRAISGMSRSDQLQLLEEEFDIPAWTLVLSLSQSTPQTALELLERGRSIFWDGILKKKAVYASGLATFGPEGKVYSTLRRLSIGSGPSQSLQICPGDIFHDNNDLRIMPADDGQEGSVVFINVHALRSDALILTNDAIHRLELPDLKEADCISYYHQFLKAQSMLIDEKSKLLASEIMCEICRWLWKTAAREVLEVLGIHDRLPEDLASPRRIWWVTTKWISVLPIHAAGDYTASVGTENPNSVFDRVVSSYVPTIRILRLLRRRSRHFKSVSIDDAATALLVAMPSTPSFPDLPFAREEVEVVKTRVSSLLRVQELIHPTSRAVIDPLKTCTLAHFACHTKIDDRDPSKSQLQLLDWRSNEALTVDKLLDLELPHCQMVYLSSCNSARDWVARETSMHIATGFLMAGVPNVIGTMWKVQDKISADVATQFYRNLNLPQDIDNMSTAAVILHKTIRKLREGGDHLVDWAPYVHFGS